MAGTESAPELTLRGAARSLADDAGRLQVTAVARAGIDGKAPHRVVVWSRGRRGHAGIRQSRAVKVVGPAGPGTPSGADPAAP